MAFMFVICMILITVNGETTGPTVTILDGDIEGVYSKSYNGNDYMAFLGIPYGTPPINEFRFKDPVPVTPWEGIKVTNETTKCLQVTHTAHPEGGLTIGSEDCLHVNVFIPGTEINPNANLDVIVFIHGGAFMFGDGGFGAPKFFMDRNLILVTLNYRVGILGFLSTGDENLPGNYGLKDQVLALRWVQKNIQYFGGNKDSITLHGHSAGGASVHYHTLSPMSRGLFSKGISTSGCALNSWAFEEKPLLKAKLVANALGCPHDDTKKLADCLVEQSPIILTDAVRFLRPWLFNPFSPIGPVVDTSSANPFLPKHPLEILLEKDVYDVPWMITYVTEEGLYPGAEFWNKTILKILNDNWKYYAPEIMHYSNVVDENIIDSVSLKIRNHYIRKGLINEKSYSHLIQMLSDRLFVTDIGIAQHLHARAIKSMVYGYVFGYISEKRETLHNLFTNVKEKLGCGHGDDLLLVYSVSGNATLEDMSEMDEKAKDLLLDIFSSFAKNGHPNIAAWTQICKNLCGYNNNLSIDQNLKCAMKREINMGEKRFWQSLPIKENFKLLN